MSLNVIGSIERGHYIARVPGRGVVAVVPLGPLGRRIGGVEVGAICANLGTPEVSGRFWRKLKRGAKKTWKGVKKTVKFAKKIADNQIISSLYQSAKAAIPPPYNVALMAVETGVRFGAAVAKGFPKAKKALPIVKKLADGKIGLGQASRLAVKVGVKPSTVKNAAAMIKLKKIARKDSRMANVFRMAERIESARQRDNVRIVRANSGRKYAVSVRRAA